MKIAVTSKIDPINLREPVGQDRVRRLMGGINGKVREFVRTSLSHLSVHVYNFL